MRSRHDRGRSRLCRRHHRGAKLAAETGDTLSITGKVEAAAFKFPNSQYRIAIGAENRGDEEKLYTFIEKACKADRTMSIDRDEETGQTIISAVGEAQGFGAAQSP